MRLYYARGTCSLSPHIALREAGLPFDLIAVDLRTKQTADGRDYRQINPRGYVPALVLDDGAVLTEGPAIVQYIADLAPASGLAPMNGTFARYQLQEWLNFISTEVHKQFSLLFDPTTPDDVKAKQRDKIANRYDWIAGQLGERPFLMGDTFTVADAYLFAIWNWNRAMAIDSARWPALQAYTARIAQRPAVLAAIQAERAEAKAAA